MKTAPEKESPKAPISSPKTPGVEDGAAAARVGDLGPGPKVPSLSVPGESLRDTPEPITTFFLNGLNHVIKRHKPAWQLYPEDIRDLAIVLPPVAEKYFRSKVAESIEFAAASTVMRIIAERAKLPELDIKKWLGLGSLVDKDKPVQDGGGGQEGEGGSK